MKISYRIDIQIRMFFSQIFKKKSLSVYKVLLTFDLIFMKILTWYLTKTSLLNLINSSIVHDLHYWAITRANWVYLLSK